MSLRRLLVTGRWPVRSAPVSRLTSSWSPPPNYPNTAETIQQNRQSFRSTHGQWNQAATESDHDSAHSDDGGFVTDEEGQPTDHNDSDQLYENHIRLSGTQRAALAIG